MWYNDQKYFSVVGNWKSVNELLEMLSVSLRNKRGPKWEPCSTPEPIVKLFETKYDTFIACARDLL